MSIKRKGILARARRIFSEGVLRIESELLSVGQWVREEKDFKGCHTSPCQDIRGRVISGCYDVQALDHRLCCGHRNES